MVASVAEDLQVELANALGVGDQIDRNDLAARDCEFAHAAFDLTAVAIIYWNLESTVAHRRAA
jgi:hypothetical protein